MTLRSFPNRFDSSKQRKLGSSNIHLEFALPGIIKDWNFLNYRRQR